MLELIIFPTEQCNFRCTYCYEDFSIGKMQREIIENIKSLISSRAEELKHLKISWFGGEPLSAKSVVYEISDYAQLESQKSGYQFHSSMTTNAYQLDCQTARRLINLGVSYFQVSLDGNQAAHDSTRRRLNGSGSFDKIWQNLIALKASDLNFSVTLRLHITPENYLSMPELINDIKSCFGGDSRFNVFFKLIADLGGGNSGSFDTLTFAKGQSVINELKKKLNHELEVISLGHTMEPYVCYAAHPNSFVIRADGRIGKCTVALDNPVNSIGNLSAGGEMKLENDKLQYWLRGLYSGSTSQLQCPLAAK